MHKQLSQGVKVKINSQDFRVRTGKRVELDQRPTAVERFFKSKEQYQELLEKHVEGLSSRQQLQYASGRHAVLLIFQGMDFITRVHPEILDTQNLSKHSRDEKHFWRFRYRSIVEMEAHLHRNGTRIIKIFLHLSKKEQKKRFLERIDEPDKNWKFSSSDIHERKYWKDYMRAYGHCLAETITHHAPWYAVPADDKENARLIVSQILMDALDDLKMAYPKSTRKRRRELQAIGKHLAKSD